LKNIYRILFALVVFLSGVALVPAIGLPAAGFSWQRYADAYVPTTLEVNHISGQPGSYFTISGSNYPANTALNVTANGILLGSIDSDAGGNLLFVINATGAELGYYTIVVDQGNGAYTRFELKANDPLWAQDVIAPVLQLPANIGNHLIFMPSIHH
jgi:hypothetical protein